LKWQVQRGHLSNFIRTEAKPHIYYRPKATPDTTTTTSQNAPTKTEEDKDKRSKSRSRSPPRSDREENKDETDQ
jgi:hypothetical protein